MADMQSSDSVPPSVPSGVSGPPRPPEDATSLQVVDHYVAWWEKEYARARRVVKKRASGVIISTSALTGFIAILGATSAALSSNVWIDVIGVATTAASALSAVLVAWDQHFHHRELWIQRSAVLHKLQLLRGDYEIASRLPWYRRRSHDRLAERLMNELQVVLSSDLETWARIQGNSDLKKQASLAASESGGLDR